MHVVVASWLDGSKLGEVSKRDFMLEAAAMKRTVRSTGARDRVVSRIEATHRGRSSEIALLQKTLEDLKTTWRW